MVDARCRLRITCQDTHRAPALEATAHLFSRYWWRWGTPIWRGIQKFTAFDGAERHLLRFRNVPRSKHGPGAASARYLRDVRISRFRWCSSGIGSMARHLVNVWAGAPDSKRYDIKLSLTGP